MQAVSVENLRVSIVTAILSDPHVILIDLCSGIVYPAINGKLQMTNILLKDLTRT